MKLSNEKLIVSTGEFWQKMGDPRFIRLDKLSGRIGDDIFVTLEAPEDVPGFMEGVVAGIRRKLGLK